MTHLLEKYKVIPVIALNDEEDVEQKLTLLNEANILVAEITFRTEYALEGTTSVKSRLINRCNIRQFDGFQ